MSEKEYTYKQERLARYAKALGNPARIAIMEFLAAQDECFFGQLHEKLPIAKALQNALSHLTAASVPN